MIARSASALSKPSMPPTAELVADKGYDSKALRDWLVERGTTTVIPPRKNRKVQYHYDKTVYRALSSYPDSHRNFGKLLMAALRNFNGLASWRNADNSLQSVNLTMPPPSQG